MPLIPVYDLALDNSGNLAAGTFARGIWSYDIAQLEMTNTVEVNESSLKVIPTVSSDYINVSGVDKGVRLEILTIDGHFVRSDYSDQSIDINGLNSGIYIIGNKKYGFTKFIKQ